MPYITANGHRIHYTDTASGNEKAKSSSNLPIVMIHGLGSSQNYYYPVLPELQDYRCLPLDTYGAARSTSQGEKLSLEALAADVVGVLDALGIPRAVVVGHSMGGTMAVQLAATYPDRIAGIVCIGPVNPSSVKPEMFSTRIETVLKDGMEPLANTIPKSATNSQSTALQRAMIRELILGQNPKSYASHCQVIVDMRPPNFDAVKCPVLVLAGDEDMSAPLAGCEHIHEHVASSKKELKVMKGVGHWHCIEAGDRVGREVKRFCASL